MKVQFIKLFVTLFIISLFSFCSNPETPKDNKSPEVVTKDSIKPVEKPKKNPYENVKMEVKTFKGANGWGYDIKGGMNVHQPNIPAMSGNKGFNTEEEAKAAGNFVIYKLQTTGMPTVSPQELDSLGVLK